MSLARISALGFLLLSSSRLLAQSGAGGTGNDSLISLSPAQRYAQICPGPRDANTGAIIGRVRDVDDSTALANATVSTQWIDLKDTKGHLSGASGRTSGAGFYLLCGVPIQMRLNLRSERGGYIGSPAQTALDANLIGNVDFDLRRTDRMGNDTSASPPRAQKLAAVTIDEKEVLPSWMERSGFEERRKMALGAFVTEKEIAMHTFSDLSSVLRGVRGLRFIASGPIMIGVASLRGGVTCKPNYFLDGAPFPLSYLTAYEELSQIAHPEAIKGIEVYSSPGTIPAQYDLMSSTGCGSIVIWTR